MEVKLLALLENYDIPTDRPNQLKGSEGSFTSNKKRNHHFFTYIHFGKNASKEKI